MVNTIQSISCRLPPLSFCSSPARHPGRPRRPRSRSSAGCSAPSCTRRASVCPVVRAAGASPRPPGGPAVPLLARAAIGRSRCLLTLLPTLPHLSRAWPAGYGVVVADAGLPAIRPCYRPVPVDNHNTWPAQDPARPAMNRRPVCSAGPRRPFRCLRRGTPAGTRSCSCTGTAWTRRRSGPWNVNHGR